MGKDDARRIVAKRIAQQPAQSETERAHGADPAGRVTQPDTGRIDEARDITRYLINLLVFLALMPFAQRLYAWVAGPMLAKLGCTFAVVATLRASAIRCCKASSNWRGSMVLPALSEK